jgi:hypothetical protein
VRRYAECRIFYCYADCRLAECYYAESRGAKCVGLKMIKKKQKISKKIESNIIIIVSWGQSHKTFFGVNLLTPFVS